MAIANIVTDINKVISMHLWYFTLFSRRVVSNYSDWQPTPHSDVKLGGVSTNRLEKAIVCMFRSQLVDLRALELEAR